MSLFGNQSSFSVSDGYCDTVIDMLFLAANLHQSCQNTAKCPFYGRGVAKRVVVGCGEFANRNQFYYQSKMKGSQKLRKEKSPLMKPQTATSSKNANSKKPSLKKQEFAMPKTLCFANVHNKTSTGFTSGTQSSKQFNPSAASCKNSPKASLGEAKSPPPRDGKLKNFQLAEKNKEEIKKSLANVIKVYYPQKKTCLDNSFTEVTKDTTQKEEGKLARNDFHFIEIIGEGGYGKVWKVELNKTKKLYAMKEMSKALIVMKKSVDNVLNQRKILEGLASPFIANMCCAFNDRDNLYLIMDLLPGADLRCRLAYIHSFTEQQAKFLIACILTALDYIHRKKIFHRDIKPQNLVFDEQGYLRLTDFGIARAENSKQPLDASGTPGYMAPQVLCKQLHSYEVDFYAVGIIAHELMLSKRPYGGNNRIEIRDAILSKQHMIKKQEVPEDWSVQAADFVNKLIIRAPAARLGAKGGIKEIKAHPWLNNFNWTDLEAKKIKSPFREKECMYEVTEREEEFSEAMMQYKLLQRVETKVDVFAKYYFQLGQL